jgi:ferritin-like metal-binding protein YciE
MTSSMRDLLVRSIVDLHSAESQIEAVLPEMIAKATDDPLREMLSDYHRLTSDRRGRLETLAPALEADLEATPSLGMQGILRDELATIREVEHGPVCDAAIIGCAQKVQHYEIAAYGTAASHARHLGEKEAADLLSQTLDEEKGADRRLSGIAENRVNKAAVEG